MCFWFVLETLRLIYKKSVCFKYWAVSILFDLLSPEKSSTVPYKIYVLLVEERICCLNYLKETK